jgi:transposase InsO family protein
VPANTAQTMYLANLTHRLQTAGHGQRGELVAEAAAWLGCSPQAVYARLRNVGFQSGRKLRKDKGDSALTRDEVIGTAALMAASWRANGKQLLGVGDAIDIAVANGVLGTRISEERMLRLMRAYGCHPSQLQRQSPHVTMRSLHPNHVWQLDASICVLYRLRNGKTQVMDQRKFNARKPRDLAAIINERLLRYAITDHASGALYARYYLTPGEDQHTLFEFLMEAFQRRAEGLMYGVPLLLVWDAGSANMAHAIRALLTALAIVHWAHKPGNARAKGQVECIHNVIERKFEGRLAFQNTESLEQLNAQLDLWLTDFNGNARHSRHGHTRWSVWQTIREDQLRLCPPVELCRDLLYTKPLERLVNGNLHVQYTCKGYPPAQYSVAHVPGVRAGERVTLMVNPYRMPNVFVVGEDEHGAVRYHECEPVAEDRYGFPVNSPVFGERYQALADTDVDSVRKEVLDMAYGERDAGDAATARAKGRVAFDGRIDAMKDVAERAAQVPAFIQRHGTELHVPNPAHVELKPLSHVDALFALRSRLNRALSRDESLLVAERYPDGVPHEAFEALLDLIQNPTAAAETEPPRRLFAVK